MKKFFGGDDILAIIATLSFTGACVTMLYGTKEGVWKPQDEVTAGVYREGLKVFFIGKVFYGFCTWIIKISFSITLLRIAKARYQIYLIWTVIIITTTFTCFYLTFIITTCYPVAYYWNRAVGAAGTCRNPHRMVIASYFQGVIIFGADTALTLIPVFMVKGMNMDSLTKKTVMFLLGLGSVTSIATFARIPYIGRLAESDNFVFRNYEIVIWSGLEVCIGIVATGAATLRPLFSKIFLSSQASSSAHSDNAEHSLNNHTRGINSSSNRDPYAAYNLQDLESIAAGSIYEGSTIALELGSDGKKFNPSVI